MQRPPRRNRILLGALLGLALVSTAALIMQERSATAQRVPSVTPAATATTTPTLTATVIAANCPRGQVCVSVTPTLTGTATATSTATATATATVTGTVPPVAGATLSPGQTAVAAQSESAAPGAIAHTPFFDVRACTKVTVFAAADSPPGTPPSGTVDIFSSPDGQRDYGLLATISLTSTGGGVSPSGFGYAQAFTGIASSFTNNLISGVSTVVTLTPATPHLRFRLTNPGSTTMNLTVMLFCTT